MPAVLCGVNDKTQTYASAEQFFLSYVTHTVRPWVTNIEQELKSSVITGGSQFFASFILEDLLRGDIATRYAAHQIAVNTGWASRNEIRVKENMNRGPAALDKFLEPMNMAQAGTQVGKDASRGNVNDGGANNARVSGIIERVAQRLVRKEVAAIVGAKGKLGAAQRFAADTEKWVEWVTAFYVEHAESVSHELHIEADIAESYCTSQCKQLVKLGAGYAESMESESVQSLVKLANGGER